jgi:hypothetical protein
MNISSFECINLAINLATNCFKQRFTAAFTIGSLAHGGFEPLVSDVDLAFIIAEPISDGDQITIDRINAEIKNSKLPYSERVSIFWSSWDQLERGVISKGRFPAIDRLDFINHRKLLHGVDSGVELKTPAQQDFVIEAAEFALAKLLTQNKIASILNPQNLAGQGARQTSKTILFPVRFVFTGATGKIGTTESAVNFWQLHYENHSSNALVKAAFKWRSSFDENEANRLLPTNLAEIYLEFIRKYKDYCIELGNIDIATDLEKCETLLLKNRILKPSYSPNL